MCHHIRVGEPDPGHTGGGTGSEDSYPPSSVPSPRLVGRCRLGLRAKLAASGDGISALMATCALWPTLVMAQTVAPSTGNQNVERVVVHAPLRSATGVTG